MDSDINFINERLRALPNCFAPLKHFADRYLSKGYRIQDNCIRLGKFRKYDHDHFQITIFPPADPAWLIEHRSFEIPLEFMKFLSYSNGLILFEVRLFGLAPSMQESPPRLDRSRLQCLDLTTANESWIINVRDPPAGTVYIGSGPYTHHENTFYFMDETGRVWSLLESGRQVGEWPSLWELIAEEGAAEERRM